MDKLNYFEPYSSDPGHENQLTRAYLVVLRLVPMALADFLDLVREDQREKGYDHVLPSLSELGRAIQTETQTGSLAEDKSHGVSLLMTNEHFEPSQPVGMRDGDAVYDGVLTFDQHVLTLENKPRVRDVWEGQLSPSLPDEEIPLTFEEKYPLEVLWRDVIDRLARLKASDRLPPASAGLVGDFLEYVAEYFDYLNPYHSFEICDRSENRLNERGRQVLEDVGDEQRVQPGAHEGYKLELDGKPAREIYLRARVDEDEGANVRTSVHPGDLTGQARAFYDAVDRDAVVELARDNSWTVEPNLHLSFRGTHLVYSSVDVDPGAYIDYWRDHRDRIGQTRGDNTALKEAISELVEDDQLTGTDFGEFERKFLKTDRDHVNVNPGMSFRYRWPLERAKQLDEADRFIREYRETVNPVLALWGQSLPNPAG